MAKLTMVPLWRFVDSDSEKGTFHIQSHVSKVSMKPEQDHKADMAMVPYRLYSFRPLSISFIIQANKLKNSGWVVSSTSHESSPLP
jgi:hypothetical protein